MLVIAVVAQTLLSVPAQARVPVPQLQTDSALYHAGDHLYSLAKTDGDALLLLDYDSGRFSRLRQQGSEFVGGPSVGIDSPVAVRVKVGEQAITIDREGKHIVAHRLDAFTTESITLINGGLRLEGTLYRPRIGGRHPAIVAAPGGGNATRRSMALPAPYFARRGIAVLALDKRGNGESSGDWRTATFENLATDLLVAVAALRTRPDIDPHRVGIYASSQGGWIAPIAAAESSSVAFVVCAACPATSMPEQELIRTRAELRADGFDASEIQNAVAYRKLLFDFLQTGAHQGELEAADQKARHARWYARFGGVIGRDSPLALWWQMNDRYVPTDFWKRVSVPALLLFGGLDTGVPPSEHATRIAAADPRAKVVIVPNVDHEGFIARTGGRDEVPRLDRIPPRAFEPTINWILAR